MLRQMGSDRNLEAAHTIMKEAAFPVPFPSVLEYNSPAHGTWNIVHMGMLIPQAHQIYVCADNCNRGVILTAAEMNAADRFSSIYLQEEDLINGNMEELIIDGVCEILQKLKKKPSVILLFTVCVHHFLGTDLDYIYSELRRRNPNQLFVDCYMDPIMQKGGLTPDQKLRIGMYTCLEKRDKNRNQINIIGNDLPTLPTCEIFDLFRQAGQKVKDITCCESFDEYLEMSESWLNLVYYPNAKVGCEKLSGRLDMEMLYLPACFGYEEITEHLGIIADKLGISRPDTDIYIQRCEMALEELKNLIGDTSIALDITAHPRVLGLAKLLLEHGFRVVRLYLDAFSKEEEQEYLWLKENASDLEIYATIHPNMRLMPRKYEGKILAVGQKAAYFTGTEHFVNMVEGGGLYGFDGICKLAQWMMQAYLETKDASDLISRKGLGCESCI